MPENTTFSYESGSPYYHFYFNRNKEKCITAVSQCAILPNSYVNLLKTITLECQHSASRVSMHLLFIGYNVGCISVYQMPAFDFHRLDLSLAEFHISPKHLTYKLLTTMLCAVIYH